jgi:hypothetical protein
MTIPRRIVALTISVGLAVGLFLYLSGTLVGWRVGFSALLFVATYFLVDGFLRRA